jgi:hypothetical protein
VSGHQREVGGGCPALDDIQVGVTDAAGGDPDEDHARAGSGFGHIPERQGIAALREAAHTLEEHRLHATAPGSRPRKFFVLMPSVPQGCGLCRGNEVSCEWYASLVRDTSLKRRAEEAGLHRECGPS